MTLVLVRSWSGQCDTGTGQCDTGTGQVMVRSV